MKIICPKCGRSHHENTPYCLNTNCVTRLFDFPYSMNVNCNSKRHKIIFHENGRVELVGHPYNLRKAEIALCKLADNNFECFKILKEYVYILSHNYELDKIKILRNKRIIRAIAKIHKERRSRREYDRRPEIPFLPGKRKNLATGNVNERERLKKNILEDLYENVNRFIWVSTDLTDFRITRYSTMIPFNLALKTIQLYKTIYAYYNNERVAFCIKSIENPKIVVFCKGDATESLGSLTIGQLTWFSATIHNIDGILTLKNAEVLA